MQLLFGFILATIAAYLAYGLRSLNLSGMVAAILVGTIIFGLGGWEWTIVLLAFFITSSGFTLAFKKRKLNLSEKFSKSGRRDAAQVLSNGGLAAFLAGLHFFFPQAAWIWLAYTASLAAVNADTWATELGVLSPHAPRLIVDPRRVVEKGTSGGVTLAGTLASLAGAALIAMLAIAFAPKGISVAAHWSRFFLIAVAGLLGSLFDSFLGATVQAIYHCPACTKETEGFPLHACGTRTMFKRGWPWLTNDLVNVGCALFAILVVCIFEGTLV